MLLKKVAIYVCRCMTAFLLGSLLGGRLAFSFLGLPAPISFIIGALIGVIVMVSPKVTAFWYWVLSR